MSEATPSATQFFKWSCKISSNPGLQASLDALHTFAAWSNIEVGLKLKLPKNRFNKKCAPKILFLNEKKSNFSTLRRAGKARQCKASQYAYNPGLWLIL